MLSMAKGASPAGLLLGDGASVKALAERLATCEAVSRFDTAEEREAWTLTHAFSDLEGSFRVYLDALLPRLVQGDLSPEEVHDLLLDIGEEFRHIAYHLNDTRFYTVYMAQERAVREERE